MQADLPYLTLVYVVCLLTLGACTWFAVLIGLLDRRLHKQVSRLVLAKTANMDHDCERLKREHAGAISAVEADRDHYLRKLQESELNYTLLRDSIARERNNMQEQLCDAAGATQAAIAKGEADLERERRLAAEQIAMAAAENRRLAAEAETRVADALAAAKATHYEQLKGVAEGVLNLRESADDLLNSIIKYVDSK